MGLTLNTMIVFSVKYLLPLTHDYSCNDSILLLASRLLSASDSSVRLSYIVNENGDEFSPVDRTLLLFVATMKAIPMKQAIRKRWSVDLESISDQLCKLSVTLAARAARWGEGYDT